MKIFTNICTVDFYPFLLVSVNLYWRQKNAKKCKKKKKIKAATL